MNLKKDGKLFTSKSVGTGPSSYEKKNLSGRGLTRVEKQCLVILLQITSTENLLKRVAKPLSYGETFIFSFTIWSPVLLIVHCQILNLFQKIKLCNQDYIYQRHLESFEMWCWRRMEKITWTDHVRNEEVLLRVNEQRNIIHGIINLMCG